MSELREFGIQPAVRGFEVYDQLLAAQNTAHPARQGFDALEYEAAMIDPDAASTDIQVETGETLAVPQLVPLRHIKWLNEDFYAKTFPSEHDAGAIMCFNNSLGVPVAEVVQDGLKNLGEKGGVLVFDYPTSDADYLGNVQSMLHNLGIKSSGIQELGTQTYFAGKVHLKRLHASLEAPKGLEDSYRDITTDGRYEPSRLTSGASLHTTLPMDLAQRSNQFYESAFTVLNDHPCKQGLSPEEFTAMVADDGEVVKLLFKDQDELESLCILGEDLTKFDWINTDYFASSFPEETKSKQIVYFPAIATDPTKQGGRNSEALVELIAELVEAGDNEIVVAFDCCDINNGFLDIFLGDMINKTPQANIRFLELDVQRYCAVKLAS